MYQLIIMCHGRLATELKNTVEMISGVNENMHGIVFLEGEGLDDIEARLLDVLDTSKKTFIACDIKGGSPFNVAFKQKFANDEISIFTGVNVPLLLELSMMLENDCFNEAVIRENVSSYVEFI